MAEQKVWTTSDGTQIPIRKLGDTHLLNIVSYLDRLKRRQDNVLQKLPPLLKEAKRRGILAATV